MKSVLNELIYIYDGMFRKNSWLDEIGINDILDDFTKLYTDIIYRNIDEMHDIICEDLSESEYVNNPKSKQIPQQARELVENTFKQIESKIAVRYDNVYTMNGDDVFFTGINATKTEETNNSFDKYIDVFMCYVDGTYIASTQLVFRLYKNGSFEHFAIFDTDRELTDG